MSYTIKGNYDEVNTKWTFDLTGEVDISNAHLLKEELNTSYNKKSADVTINAEGLTYIDSTGLGVIIGLYGTMKNDGKKLTLINPRDNIKKLLKVTQFDKILC